MAFFKFRSPAAGAVSEGGTGGSTTIEAMRRRARHRLIGATLLVVLGVVAFPVLFDTQPRPIPVDIAIDIPDRHKAKPLALPGDVAGGAPAAPTTAVPPTKPPTPQSAAAAAPTSPPSASQAPSPSVPAAASLEAREHLVEARPAAAASSRAAASTPARASAPAPAAPATSRAAGPTAATAVASAPPRASSAAASPADGERARALLEGRAPDKAASTAVDGNGRYIVQVGAFGEAERVRDVRAKLERAGLKTYVHVIDTPEGKRTRVRLGPFASRAEADAAAAKARSLDLPGTVLSL